MQFNEIVLCSSGGAADLIIPLILSLLFFHHHHYVVGDRTYMSFHPNPEFILFFLCSLCLSLLFDSKFSNFTMDISQWRTKQRTHIYIKKKLPYHTFFCHEISITLCLWIRSLYCMYGVMSVGGGRVYIVSWVTQTPPPKKYSQTNNNLPQKASSTNKKASLERIILNIEQNFNLERINLNFDQLCGANDGRIWCGAHDGQLCGAKTER